MELVYWYFGWWFGVLEDGVVVVGVVIVDVFEMVGGIVVWCDWFII